MSLKQKNAGAAEKRSNRPEIDTFILEIEKNRIQMQLASHRAAIMNCPIQASEETLVNAEARQPSRGKKSR